MNDPCAQGDRIVRLLERWALAAVEYWQGVDSDAAMICYDSD